MNPLHPPSTTYPQEPLENPAPLNQPPPRQPRKRQTNNRHERTPISDRRVPDDKPPRDLEETPADNWTKTDIRRINALQGYYVSLGMSVALANPMDGRIIIEGSEKRAQEIARVCKVNPAFAKAIDRFIAGSAYSLLIGGHLGMLNLILMNHGMSIGDYAQKAVQRLQERYQKRRDERTNGTTDEQLAGNLAS